MPCCFPGLSILRNFKNKGLALPRYQVYQATNFIAATNGIPLASAQQIALRMKLYVERFIQNLYPDIAEAVVLNFGESETFLVQQNIADLSASIREQAAAVLAIQKIIATLDTSASRHSNDPESYYQYSAANVLYNGAIFDKYPFKNDCIAPPRVILPIGGKAEVPFFALTSRFAHESSNVIPFLTHLGSRPTYYPYPEKGDPLTPDAYEQGFLNDFNSIADGPIRNDLVALKKAGLTPDLLRQIYPSL